MNTCMGVVEVVSIPRGIEAGDAMLKAAHVELAYAGTVCPGKYVVIVWGCVAAVEASVAAGSRIAGEKTIDSLVIPSVDSRVPRAMNACTEIDRVEAVGTLEMFSVCAAIHAADAAVKAASVELIEVRLGRGLGGKSFVVLTGDVASVGAAVEAGRVVSGAQGLLSDCCVVPHPHSELIRALL